MGKTLARLVFVLLLAAGLPKWGSAQARDTQFSVHLVTTEIKPGVRLCEEFQTGLKIAYEPTALLTLADVDSVGFAREGDRTFSVVLVLSSAGRARLHQMSVEHVGRRIALLVDNVAHAIPLIREPLHLHRLPVGYYSDEGYARQLAAQLTTALERRQESNRAAPQLPNTQLQVTEGPPYVQLCCGSEDAARQSASSRPLPLNLPR